MEVSGKNYRAVWLEGQSVCMINQILLPYQFEVFKTTVYDETCLAIKNMIVRGAGTIGATAAFAMAQAFLEAGVKDAESYVCFARKEIEATRPTAFDLFYAVEKVFEAGLSGLKTGGIRVARQMAVNEALSISDIYVANAKAIGIQGNELIKDGMQILTHCNAGWLGLLDWGSALSPIYLAHASGKRVHVFVDETRPRSQGARLTAWELMNAGIPHTIIPDNAAAHLMSIGKIDMVITGADRIAANGDTANKIGTLEKAIVAKEYSIPFYIAAPSSTFDRNCPAGSDIIIEERDEDEVLYVSGLTKKGHMEEVLVCNPGSHAFNPAFDITPAKYISGYITEKDILVSLV